MTELTPFRPPLHELYVYVTNSCNCACTHCWIVPENNSAERPARFIRPQIFEAAVNEAKAFGLHSVKWTGGEPTIHPEFPQLLRIQKKHELRGRLETNGMQVTQELATLMRQCGVTGVSVSLDGAVAGTHDAIRNVTGGFKRTLAGIEKLVKAGYRPGIIMSLMRANISELVDLLELAVELGAGNVKLNIVQPALRGAELLEAGGTLSLKEILVLNERLQQEIQPRYDLPILLDIPLAFQPLNNLLRSNGLSSCGIQGILGLLADGHYALCGIGEHVPELVFGQAGVGHLQEIWVSNPVLVELRNGLPNALQGVCGNCLMKNVCLGSCVAINYQNGKSLLAPYWFCEAAYAERKFPENRLISRQSE